MDREVIFYVVDDLEKCFSWMARTETPDFGIHARYW